MRGLPAASLVLVFITTSLLAQINPVPLVNQPLVPASVPPGNPAFTLQVNGAGFSANAVLEWNGSPRTTEVLSSSSLTAQVNASDVLHFGTASVTVTNPAPGGGTSNVVYFPIRFPWSSVAMDADPNFTSTNAVAVTVGDFNNDGKLDVATAMQGAILVYLGDGKGNFQAPIRTGATMGVPWSMFAADINGDGKPDLVIVNRPGSAIIFIGDGKGKFTRVTKIGGTGEAVWFYSVGDVNGDGKLDIVADNFSPRSEGGELLIYLGNGDGTFQSGQFVTSNGCYAGLPALGDFNGDGFLDIAAQDCNSLQVLLNNGDGTFQSFGSYKTVNSGSVFAADVNGDGKLDLVTDGGSVLLGHGDGAFTVEANSGISGILNAILDFNGDGRLDLVGNQFQIQLGNGDGTFQSPILPIPLSLGRSFSVGDFNDDGLLDVVAPATLYWQIPLGVSPLSLNFGNQNVGTSSTPQTVTITNLRTFPLSVTGLSITGSDPQDYSQTNNCPSILAPGGTCQAQVTFTPTTGGARSASLAVAYGGLGSPQRVPLSGNGVPVGTVSLTPTSLTFATRLINTTSPAKFATLANTGTVAVNISSISAAAPFSQTNNCPSSLPVGGSCQISVRFTPTSRGTANGTLSVTDDAQGSPQTVALAGTGTVVKLSPIGVNFGDQKVGTTSPPVPITLTNEDSNASLNISNIGIKGINTGDFAQTNNCGSSVPPGGSCTIKVTFTPHATGQRSASLTVIDDGGGSPQTVPLAGTGT